MLQVNKTKIIGLCVFALVTYCIIIYKSWPEFGTLSTNDGTYFNHTLTKLLKPRYIGSSGHSEVAEFLLKELKALGFKILRNKLKKSSFKNVVGIMNKKARKYILLSCHYDSKYIEHVYNYVGATDGAVSCAILLNVAKSLELYLKDEFYLRGDIGLVLAFFDGHESFENVLADSNSLNGSRQFVYAKAIPLQKIEVVIALNLIGAPNHIYLSHYKSTNKLHELLVQIEDDLRTAGKLENCHKLFFARPDYNNDIEDDHYPFLSRGVPAMHVVPHAYPDVWHTAADNLENLHWPTIRNMLAIFTDFLYEYISTSELYTITEANH